MVSVGYRFSRVRDGQNSVLSVLRPHNIYMLNSIKRNILIELSYCLMPAWPDALCWLWLLFYCQHLPGSTYTYIPYHLDEDGQAFAREGADPHSSQVVLLVKRLKSVLQETRLAVRSVAEGSVIVVLWVWRKYCIQERMRIIASGYIYTGLICTCFVCWCRKDYKAMFFKSLKQVRENKEGEELKKVSWA